MERFASFVSVLPATGEMEFSEYIAALRAANVRGENWLRAKHAGAIVARLDENGRVLVSRGDTGEGE
jgi:hypothetical protein